ncbi:hypothetical protein F5887DRAFT_982777 [Amanita rubescens]|nr:hypothetical protein F5887DRAFT_990175 [Amanita rubescens]KAF8338427.1 hypothetical protein F5887DRAFT_982777 [Amanita rubescens]
MSMTCSVEPNKPASGFSYFLIGSAALRAPTLSMANSSRRNQPWIDCQYQPRRHIIYGLIAGRSAAMLQSRLGSERIRSAVKSPKTLTGLITQCPLSIGPGDDLSSPTINCQGQLRILEKPHFSTRSTDEIFKEYKFQAHSSKGTLRPSLIGETWSIVLPSIGFHPQDQCPGSAGKQDRGVESSDKWSPTMELVIMAYCSPNVLRTRVPYTRFCRSGWS